MSSSIVLFLFAGLVSMSGALSAGALNKLPVEERPGFMRKPSGQTTIIMVGNLAAVTLLAAMVYGFKTQEWWVPLSCLLVSFPVVHLLFLKRLLGDFKNLWLMLVLVIVAIVLMYLNWPASAD